MAVQQWYRSQKMEYLSMALQEDRAYSVLTELGGLGMFQLVDLNPSKTAFQRRYINEISRIDVVDRQIRYIEDTLAAHEIVPHPAPTTEELLLHLNRRALEGQTPNALLVDFETLLAEKDHELKTLVSLQANLMQEMNRSIEIKYVLQSLGKFAREDPNIPRGATNVDLNDDDLQAASLTLRFRFLAGTISLADKGDFERMIFRATRGNAYMRFDEIPETTLNKAVFVVFFQAQVMEDKIVQVCKAFQAQTFALPSIDSSQEIAQTLSNTEQEISERTVITRKNSQDLIRLLTELGRHVLGWKLTLKKEKAVYHGLNWMDSSVTGVLRCEGWVASDFKDQVAECVARVHGSAPNWVNVVPIDQRPKKPPTYYKTNKFTEAYQLIIDTYGVAKYEEVNPALFSAVTFPFCFGVMFGDVGHGIALLAFSLFLLYKEKSLAKMELNEVANLLFSGRYMLVLMSVFSIYCGFIYNDVMAMGLALSPVSWEHSPLSTNSTIFYQKNPLNPQVYQFGADPTWKLAANEIAFYNSFKMKFAVIFGVLHMLVGLVLKGMNAIHFHKGKSGPNLDLWFEVIPQILFMCLLFGYMDFLIIYKWCIPWGDACDREGMCQPPSIITTMISLGLSPGKVKDPMYAGQGTVQVVLLLAALCCVPLMLCVKPYILVKRMRRHEAEHMALNEDHHSDHSEHGENGGEEEHSVGDIVIHQAIETIEFVLGSISNTASYLRLWALSLAHSQLAAVFWERSLMPFLTAEASFSSVLFTYLGCAVFFAITFVVLLLMDNLECFLHTLRLHWVEFMNKFFKAEGLKFEPLSFDSIFELAKQQKPA